MPNLAGCGDGGMRPGAKGCRPTLEAGKGQETDSPLEPPASSHTNMLILAQRNLSQTSDLQNCKIKDVLFKPLNLW